MKPNIENPFKNKANYKQEYFKVYFLPIFFKKNE